MHLKALAGAFLRSIRQEGIGPAMRKVMRYLRMRRPVTRAAEQFMEPAWKALSKFNAFFPPTPPSQVFSRPKVALIGDFNLPQCKKYRVEQVIELFGMLGAGVSIAHYQDHTRAISILQDATHLFEYRLPLIDLCLQYRYEARRLGLPVLYDIDDPLFSYPAYATYGNMKGVNPKLHEKFLKDTAKYLEMMNGADVLCVSTPGLQSHLAMLTSRPVLMRRNLADRETLSLGKDAIEKTSRMAQDHFTVSFASGSLGHEYDFEVAADGIFQFIRKHPDARLMIIGHFPESFIPQDLIPQTIWHKFSDYQSYLKHLASSDCMVMPLADDLFNSCKSAVRAIDAASVAVPALASDIGDNSALVIDNETGILISDNDDWAKKLEMLYLDRPRTKALGQNARANLEARWASSNAPHIIDPALVSWLIG